MGDQSGSGSPKAEWYPDPLGRHQFRYWDGTCWTHHVANNGEASTDPLDQQPAKASSPAPNVPEATDPVERLIAELRAEMHDARIATPIVESLAALCDARSVPLLLEVAAGGSNVDSRGSLLPHAAEHALREMGQAAPRRIIPALHTALSDPSAVGRPAAARLLSLLEPESDDDLFVYLLEDKDARVVVEATEVLAQRRCMEAVPGLEQILAEVPGDEDDWFTKYEWPRRAAAKALGQIRGADAVPCLVNLLSWKSEFGLRCAVVDALGAIGSAEAFDPLLELAIDVEHPAQAGHHDSGLVAALVATAGPGATEQLVAVLGDAGPGVDDWLLDIVVKCLLEVGEGAAAALPLLQLVQRLSEEASASAGEDRLDWEIDPWGDSGFGGAVGRALVALCRVLERSAAGLPDTTLRAIADLGPVVGPAYLGGDPELYGLGGHLEYGPVATDRITELARSELDRREGR